MPSSLEYAAIERPVRSLAVPAFVCGICSGPAAIALAILVAANHLSEDTKEVLAIAALVAVLGGALAFGCVARAKLPTGVLRSARLLANFAIAAPLAWGAAIFVFVSIALRQCC